MADLIWFDRAELLDEAGSNEVVALVVFQGIENGWNGADGLPGDFFGLFSL